MWNTLWATPVFFALALLCHQAPAFAQKPKPSGAQAKQGSQSPPSVSERLQSLGSYEKSALQYALQKRGLQIENTPSGKIVGAIHVVNLDVFGKAEGFLRLVNFLHVTTKEDVIKREVLLRPGDLWDFDIARETKRKIRDPLFTSLVVIAPVRSAKEGQVDLLVVTRDIWSLRANSSFEVLEGTLTGLQLSVAENNIFGRRKHGALVFDMRQGNFRIGPQYVDKALLGSRLRLVTQLRAIFGRSSKEFEGTSSRISVNYPLWSLRQKWGGGVNFRHFDSTVRTFRGTEVQRLDNPDTPEIEEIQRSYVHRSMRTEVNAVRAFGSSIKHQVTLGHQFAVVRPDFVPGFVGSESDREFLRREFFPRSERASALFVRYRLFTPKFVVYRNLDSYDLSEDIRLGPEVTAGASAALKALGSESNFYEGNLGAAWTFDLAEDGFVRASAGVSSRLQSGELIDNHLSTSLKVATPRLGNVLRLVAKAKLGVRLRERGNGTFFLGGGNGLRGYVISEFEGQKQLLTNVELRSKPVRLLFARVGGLLFWDMGHAADRLGDLRLKHGVGMGLRYLVPQLQPIVFRIDWAIPLQGQSAGFPGRVSAGVAQAF